MTNDKIVALENLALNNDLLLNNDLPTICNFLLKMQGNKSICINSSSSQANSFKVPSHTLYLRIR